MVRRERLAALTSRPVSKTSIHTIDARLVRLLSLWYRVALSSFMQDGALFSLRLVPAVARPRRVQFVSEGDSAVDRGDFDRRPAAVQPAFEATPRLVGDLEL